MSRLRLQQYNIPPPIPTLTPHPQNNKIINNKIIIIIIKSYTDRGCEKINTLEAEKVPAPHHFFNGPSVFWFANSLLKDIRFPPLKIHTTSTWGLIANFVVELDAVLVVKTVFFGLTCIILRLMGVLFSLPKVQNFNLISINNNPFSLFMVST